MAPNKLTCNSVAGPPRGSSSSWPQWPWPSNRWAVQVWPYWRNRWATALRYSGPAAPACERYVRRSRGRTRRGDAGIVRRFCL